MRTCRAATANYRPTPCRPAPRKQPLAILSRRSPIRCARYRRRHRLRRRRVPVLGGGVRRGAPWHRDRVFAGRHCISPLRLGRARLPPVRRPRGLTRSRRGGLGERAGADAPQRAAIAFLSYAGFLFVPLAHGGVIQPSCVALGGLALATLVLKEKLPARRAAGAA